MKHSTAQYQPINTINNDFDYNQGYDKYDGNPLGDDTFRRGTSMSLLHNCCMCFCFPFIPWLGRTVEQGTRLEHHDLSGKLTVLNPGFHVRTPFVESFGQTIQMRDSTVTLPSLIVLASDGISFTIRNAQLVFRVTNPANYSLHANKANDSFPKIAEGVLSSVLRSMTSGEILPGASTMRLDDLVNKQSSRREQEMSVKKTSLLESEPKELSPVVGHVHVGKQEQASLRDVFEKAKLEFKSYEESWGVHVVSIQLTSLEPTNAHEFSQVQLNALKKIATTRADMQTLEFEAQAKQKEQIIHANTERERALIEARTKLEVAKMTLQAAQLLESNPLAQQLTLMQAGEKVIGSASSTIFAPFNQSVMLGLSGDSMKKPSLFTSSQL